MGCSVVFHKNNVFDYWLLAPSPEPAFSLRFSRDSHFSLSFVLCRMKMLVLFNFKLASIPFPKDDNTYN